MRIAFAIVSLFPWGGLQRDCLRLARLVAARGHKVTIFAARRQGNLPVDLQIEILPVRAFSNHGRNLRFGKALARAVAGRFDRVVGFDKLPGLDILYCADPCYADRRKGLFGHLMPRPRTMRTFEAACFAPEARTRVLALAEPQIKGYRRAWGTPADRITLLPPNIDSARRRPGLRGDGTRERMREQLGFPSDAFIWFAIGSQLWVKGLDRAVEALGRVPAARLIVAGLSPASADGKKLSQRAGAGERLRLLGPREDIPELMAAADLLVHVARTDTTGTVILEALVNGLPVVTTAVCGYAAHVSRAKAGIVMEEPFDPRALDQALATAADPATRARWSENAIAYGADAELYRGLERAAEIITDSGR